MSDRVASLLERAAVVLAAGDLFTRVKMTALKKFAPLMDKNKSGYNFYYDVIDAYNDWRHIIFSAVGQDAIKDKFNITDLYKPDPVPDPIDWVDALSHYFDYPPIKNALNVYVPWAKYVPWLADTMLKHKDPFDNYWPALLPYVVESKEDVRDGKVTLWSVLRNHAGDINQLSIKDVVDLLEEKASNQPARRGEVVHTFADGWTVQQLTTEEQLADEGRRMHHCVESYANDVKGGVSEIFSVRDENNKPYVTIELRYNSQEGIQKLTQAFGPFNKPLSQQPETAQSHAKEYLRKEFLEKLRRDINEEFELGSKNHNTTSSDVDTAVEAVHCLDKGTASQGYVAKTYASKLMGRPAWFGFVVMVYAYADALKVLG